MAVFAAHDPEALMKLHATALILIIPSVTRNNELKDVLRERYGLSAREIDTLTPLDTEAA